MQEGNDFVEHEVGEGVVVNHLLVLSGFAEHCHVEIDRGDDEKKYTECRVETINDKQNHSGQEEERIDSAKLINLTESNVRSTL